MSPRTARLLTLVLTTTYGLMAVLGSGGMHLLGGVSHPDHDECKHHHADCAAHDSVPSKSDGGESGERHDGTSVSRSVAMPHNCPICRWFAQCKSSALVFDRAASGALHVERLLVHGANLSCRPLYRPSRPRGPPRFIAF